MAWKPTDNLPCTSDDGKAVSSTPGILGRLRYAWPVLRERVLARELRPLILDTVRYAWSKVLPGAAGLLSVMIFVRLLGEEEYGRYALGLSLATVGASFASGWLSQAALRYYGEAWWQRRDTRKALAIGLAWSVAIGAAGLVGFSADRPREAGGRWLVEVGAVLLLFTLLAAYQFRVALLQAQLRAGAVVRVGIAQAVMSIVVPLGLLKTIGGGYTAILCGSAISYGLALWFSRAGEGPGGPGTGQEPAGPSTMNVLRILWSYGWALSLWYTATSAMPVADRFLIERAHGFAATGRYAALYDLVMRSFSLLAFPVTLAAHPRIMRYWSAGERAQARAVWRWAMYAHLALFVVVLLGVLVVGNWAVRIVLPGSGQVIAPALVPLVFAGFAWQFALLVHKPLEVDGLTPWMLVAAVAALLASVGGNLWLVPRFGPIAAAYTYGAAAVVYLALTIGFARMRHAGLLSSAGGGA